MLTQLTRQKLAIAVMLLVLAGCSAFKIDVTNPENDVYITKIALTQTYDVLSTGVQTGTISKADAAAMLVKLEHATAALESAERVITQYHESGGDYLALAKALIVEVRDSPLFAALLKGATS